MKKSPYEEIRKRKLDNLCIHALFVVTPDNGSFTYGG